MEERAPLGALPAKRRSTIPHNALTSPAGSVRIPAGPAFPAQFTRFSRKRPFRIPHKARSRVAPCHDTQGKPIFRRLRCNATQCNTPAGSDRHCASHPAQCRSLPAPQAEPSGNLDRDPGGPGTRPEFPPGYSPRHESRQCDKLSAPTPPGKFDALSCLMLKTPTRDPGGHKSARRSPARTLPPQPEFSEPTCVHPLPGRAAHQPACSHPITAEVRLMPGSANIQDGEVSPPLKGTPPLPQRHPRAARAPTRYSHCAPSASLRRVHPLTLTETTQRSAAPLPYPRQWREAGHSRSMLRIHRSPGRTVAYTTAPSPSPWTDGRSPWTALPRTHCPPSCSGPT